MTAQIARRDQRRVIAAMLSRAFFDDPAIGWIFPDPPDRSNRLPKLFMLLFDADADRSMRLVTDKGEAATFWRAPGQAQSGMIEMLVSLIPMLGCFGTAIGRGMAVGKAIDAHMPVGDYWYLHIAGCDPLHQGRAMAEGRFAPGSNGRWTGASRPISKPRWKRTSVFTSGWAST